MALISSWKARIGWIHPRVNSDIEIYDFYKAAPEDVVLVVTHLEVVDSSRQEEVDASLAVLERAVERLNMAGVDLIMKNGSPVHLRYGNEGHRQIVERMRAVAKVPVTTSAQALADAFCELSARRILMISSWRSESTDLLNNLRNFLAASDIEIAAVEGIGHQLQSIEKSKLAPQEIFTIVTNAAARHLDVDAIFIQSGTMATVGIVEALEETLGKPVVSSNVANIWGSFKPLGITPGRRCGQLLNSLSGGTTPGKKGT
jgi:maleate isomerase